MYLINKSVDFLNGTAIFAPDDKYTVSQIYVCLDLPPVKSDLKTICYSLPLYLIKQLKINEIFPRGGTFNIFMLNDSNSAEYLIKTELCRKMTDVFWRMIGLAKNDQEWKEIHKNNGKFFIPLLFDDDPELIVEKGIVLESHLELNSLSEWFNVNSIECSLLFTLKHE